MMGGVITFMSCNLFRTPEDPFFPSKWSFLERAIGIRFENSILDVFLIFAGFFWEKLLYFRRGTWYTLLHKTEGKGFGICGKMIGTFWIVERFCVFIVQKFLIVPGGPGFKTSRESIRFLYINVDNCLFRATSHINKWPLGIVVASRYQSSSSDPRPNCALSVPTSITSRGGWKRTMFVFWSSRFHPSLLWWNTLFLM